MEDDCGLILDNYTLEISIHVLRVEDNPAFDFIGPKVAISIHVLRVEDDKPATGAYGGAGISIHVLRVEDDASVHPLSKN